MSQKDVLELIIDVCSDNQKVMVQQRTEKDMLETYAVLITTVCSICGGAIRMAKSDEQNVG